jgi:gamma-glutamyltranspeptidase / glutathione hydrolase
MFTTRPELLGTFGMVSTTHWLASTAAMSMLEKGGNAFDAAVCAGFVLHIAEPHLNGPGGDMPAILHVAGEDKPRVLCGQGTAPAGATMAYYRDELGLDLAPGTGLLATAIPGAVDGYLLMLRDYGKLDLETVLESAVYYAENGAPIVPNVCNTITGVADLFRDHWPTSVPVYMPNGDVPEPGTLLGNKGIAETWKRLIKEAKAAGGDRQAQIEAARNAWGNGFVAEAIDKFCRENEVMDVSGTPHKGVLTGDDMANWRASYDVPLSYNFDGYTIFKCGAWSQGPVQLQQLALLKGFGLEDMDTVSGEFVHTITECAKLAFADRETYYGDPDFVEVPIETLLSDAYNDERRRLIGDKASLEFRPGEIDGYGAPVDYQAAVDGASSMKSDMAGIGEPTVGRPVKGDTCHIDVIDNEGNMAAVTPSGGWLQSSPVIPELGFCLGSRMQMFWLEDNMPASLRAGSRPRTTLTPSMAYREGKPYMVYGTPGGDQQDQWQTNFLLRHAVHGLNLQEAIDAPSFHNEHHPSSFYPRQASPGRLVVEGRFPKATQKDLEKRGHALEVGGDWSEGRMCAVSQEGGMLKGAANPRGMQGYAVGR